MQPIQIKSTHIYSIGLYFIAAVLIFSGSTKIIDPNPLTEALNLLKILPAPIIISISVLLPIMEIMLGIFLFVKLKTKNILTFTGALFFGFLLFAIYGTLTGMNTDCGCFGEIVKSDIGWGMVVRNSILFIIVILLYFNSPGTNVQTK